jgi:hypothetical protein
MKNESYLGNHGTNMAQGGFADLVNIACSRVVSGADNRSRTYDLRITNALLYQLSYIGFQGIVTGVTTVQKIKKNVQARQPLCCAVAVY